MVDGDYGPSADIPENLAHGLYRCGFARASVLIAIERDETGSIDAQVISKA